MSDSDKLEIAEERINQYVDDPHSVQLKDFEKTLMLACPTPLSAEDIDYIKDHARMREADLIHQWLSVEDAEIMLIIDFSTRTGTHASAMMTLNHGYSLDDIADDIMELQMYSAGRMSEIVAGARKLDVKHRVTINFNAILKGDG